MGINGGQVTITLPRDLVRKARAIRGMGRRSPVGLLRAALSDYVRRRAEEERLVRRAREAMKAHREGKTRVLRSFADLE